MQRAALLMGKYNGKHELIYKLTTVLVKSSAHLNGIFFLASLEEIGRLWKWWTVYSGVLQLTDFLGMIICDGF